MQTFWMAAAALALLSATMSGPAPTDIRSLPAIAELPDPFLREDGRRVRTPAQWKAQRKRLLSLVLRYEYGPLPPAGRNETGDLVSTRAIDGAAAEEQIVDLSMGPNRSVHTRLTLTKPTGPGPFPTIVCGDFIAGDKYWTRVKPDVAEEIVRRGYVLAEFDRAQIAPDSPDRLGVYAAYADYRGGRIAAWAWGYHRVLDYLVTRPFVDRSRLIVSGHSRGGKAVLLAGAMDERIAITAPNNSGCGGAGCFRYQGPKSEDIGAILKNFPYWFEPDFGAFIGNVDRLPFDQHTVKALVAPRALLSTEGLDDLWANPEGTQQSYLAAREVYEFLGVPDRIGIAYRPGGHEHSTADWMALLNFADRQLLGKPTSQSFDTLAFPDSTRPYTWRAPSRPSAQTHAVGGR